MTPPVLEIADLIRTAGAAFVERNRQWIRWKQVKVLRAIARCRTAALGGHLDECTRCAHRAPSEGLDANRRTNRPACEQYLQILRRLQTGAGVVRTSVRLRLPVQIPICAAGNPAIRCREPSLVHTNLGQSHSYEHNRTLHG